MKKIRIGLVGLMHANFPGDVKSQYNRSIQELKELKNELGFELYVVEEGIMTDDDAWSARKRLEDQKIDMLLIQNTAFASGTLISILAAINTTIGLWAVPEPAQGGFLQLNSFCGMNMNSSIIGEYLTERNIKYKWFYGNVGDELFINRFKITVNALTAIKNLKSARIALIGGVANGFDDLWFDERKIESIFGTKVCTKHEFSEIKYRAQSYSIDDVKDIIKEFRDDSVSVSPIAEEALERTARVYKAYLDFANDNKYDALAVSCWPKFRLEMQMVPCAAVGKLNNDGIITSCEGDVYGALTMLAMKYLGSSPALLMDLVDFDEKDQSILFWHCGVGGKKLAHKGEIRLERHGNLSVQPGRGRVPAASVSEMIYAKQEATSARFTKNGDELFLLTGDFNNPEKMSCNGSRGWMGNLKLNRKSISVRNLINTIIIQKMQHHYAVSPGDLSKDFMEMCNWLGIKTTMEVEYEDYLQI